MFGVGKEEVVISVVEEVVAVAVEVVLVVVVSDFKKIMVTPTIVNAPIK